MGKRKILFGEKERWGKRKREKSIGDQGRGRERGSGGGKT